MTASSTSQSRNTWAAPRYEKIRTFALDILVFEERYDPAITVLANLSSFSRNDAINADVVFATLRSTGNGVHFIIPSLRNPCMSSARGNTASHMILNTRSPLHLPSLLRSFSFRVSHTPRHFLVPYRTLQYGVWTFSPVRHLVGIFHCHRDGMDHCFDDERALSGTSRIQHPRRCDAAFRSRAKPDVHKLLCPAGHNVYLRKTSFRSKGVSEPRSSFFCRFSGSVCNQGGSYQVIWRRQGCSLVCFFLKALRLTSSVSVRPAHWMGDAKNYLLSWPSQ